jgi:hypothetical protein
VVVGSAAVAVGSLQVAGVLPAVGGAAGAVAEVVVPSGLVGVAGGAASDEHSAGQEAVVGATRAPAVVGAAGAVVVVGVTAEVSAGTQVGEAGWWVGGGLDAGVGSEVGVVVGAVGAVCGWLDGVTVADGVGAAATSGGGDAGLAAAGDGTVGGVPAGAGAGAGARSVVASEGASFARGERRLAGGENKEVPESDPYQESNPGATTPMSGIWSGPAASGESIAAVAAWPWGAADDRPVSDAGGAVVWARARSEAIVNPAAPAPSTEAAREVPRCVLCLPMYLVPSGTNEALS